MKYTLIARDGKVFTFYIKDLALTFLNAYGGTLIEGEVKEEVYA